MSKNTQIGELINYISVNESGNVVLSNGHLVATQNYVSTAVANLVDAAPTTLDTLNELAAALGDDPNFATTLTTSIGGKLSLTGGTLTGTLSVIYDNAGGASIISIKNSDTGFGLSSDYTVNTSGIALYPSGNWPTAARVVGLRLGTFSEAATRNTGLALVTANAGTEAERMRILSNGNVGIGTHPTNPGKKLEISDENNSTSTTSGLKIINWSLTANARAGIVFQSYDNNGAAIWTNRTGTTTGELMFGTNNSASTAETNIAERMRIYSDGVVTTKIIQLNDPTYFASNFYGIRLAGVDNGVNGTNFQIQGRTTATGGFSTLFTITNGGAASFNGTAVFSNAISPNGGVYALGDVLTSSGRLLASNGSQGANTETASILLGNRGYFTTSDIGAARISAVAIGANWYSGTGLAFYTNPGPDVTSTGAVERMRITSGGTVNIANLAGTGIRRVFVNDSGNLSAPQTDISYTISLSGITTGSWFNITAHNFSGFQGLVQIQIQNLNSDHGYFVLAAAWIFQQGHNGDPSYAGIRGVTTRPDGVSYEGYDVIESYHTAPISGRYNMRMRLRVRDAGLAAANPINLQIWVDHVVGITNGTTTLSVRSL